MSSERDVVVLFMATLGARESVARALFEAGFSSLEEVAYVPADELLATPGVESSVLLELRGKARTILLF